MKHFKKFALYFALAALLVAPLNGGGDGDVDRPKGGGFFDTGIMNGGGDGDVDRPK